jgi:hypothetical protein
MPRCPIVRPEIVRLALSGDDWLEVKKRLNTGEHRTMINAQYKTSGAQFTVDLDQMGLSKVMAYAVAWSFIGLDGQPLPLTIDTIRAIDPETFAEVLSAIDAHDAAQDAARSAEKNDRGGEMTSSVISPSAAS